MARYCLGRREVLHGDGHEVVGEVEVELLVEVVAYPRAVREQVLDRDPVVDEREVGAEHRTSCRLETQRPVLDETHDDERRQSFGPTRDANCVSGVFGISCARSARP